MINTILLVGTFLLIAVLLAFLSSAFGLTQSAEKRKKNEMLAKIPGPKTFPLFGTLASMPRTQQELLGWFVKANDEFGGLFLLRLGTMTVVFIGKNEYAAEILKGSKHSEKSYFYQSLQEWLSFGLLTSGGAKWRSRRKLITPAFHFDVLDKSLATMMKHCFVAIRKFEAFAEREEYVDVWEEISLLALDIISDFAMGVELEAQLKNPDSMEYIKNREKVTLHIVNRFRNSWLYSNWVYYNFTTRGREERKLVKRLHEFTTNVILQRWKKLQDNFEEFQNRTKKSFLDLLLLSKMDSNLSFEDIREEVDTFMFAGHDTAAAAMSFVLLVLSNHPEVMKKLQDEVDEKFAGVEMSQENTSAVKKALLSMTYLDAVLKESLRLFPSAPCILRKTSEEIELKGYKLPKGSELLLSLFAMHHDASVYPEPHAFKPERWLEKEVPLDEKPFCYVPFSAGPRNCIGQRFALMEERLVIATVVKNFDLISDTSMDNLRVYGQLILRPHDKFHIKFFKRVDESVA